MTAGALLLLGASPGRAHRDYEIPVMTIPGAGGAPLTLVRHYTDGILFADPVRLVVYDVSGAVVAQTGFFRDILVHRTSDGTVYVFGVGYLSVFFRQAWIVQGTALVPVHSPACYGYALLSALRTRWLAYGISVFLCVAGW